MVTYLKIFPRITPINTLHVIPIKNIALVKICPSALSRKGTQFLESCYSQSLEDSVNLQCMPQNFLMAGEPVSGFLLQPISGNVTKKN